MKAEYRKTLTEEQKRILAEKGTEAPFSGELLHNKQKGVYQCAACGQDLFTSETKYDSGSGWPSFYDVISSESVKLIRDNSHGMIRSEVVCSNCEGHLGHVFQDGPREATGLRYCINSASLQFEKKDQ
jgi:peptide-methionine (R)-S-oxide reductase